MIAAVEAFGAGQLLPGSDYPFLLGWESYDKTFAHVGEAGLADTDVNQVLYQNAQKLLGL
jgi:aminocarboxymuconate-semialdehyde decarboxylase